jgi:hypothetical protein
MCGMDQQEEEQPRDGAADTLTLIAVVALVAVVLIVAWQIASLQP